MGSEAYPVVMSGSQVRASYHHGLDQATTPKEWDSGSRSFVVRNLVRRAFKGRFGNYQDN